MRKGGLTAANCTCSIWEGFADTMRNIALWKRWFTDRADLITPVRVTSDIHRAKAEGKTGIILGFQNTCVRGSGRLHPVVQRAGRGCHANYLQHPKLGGIDPSVFPLVTWLLRLFHRGRTGRGAVAQAASRVDPRAARPTAVSHLTARCCGGIAPSALAAAAPMTVSQIGCWNLPSPGPTPTCAGECRLSELAASGRIT